MSNKRQNIVFLRPLETMVSRPLHGRMTSNKTARYSRYLAMILPTRSQLIRELSLTQTDLAEIFKCRKIHTTGALLRIRSSREAAAARQPDRMVQRHSLRQVRPRSRPGLLATGPYVVFQQQSGRYPKSLPRASRSDVLSVTFGSRQILEGLFPSARKRQPAASSSLLILIRAVASFMGTWLLCRYGKANSVLSVFPSPS